MKDGIFLLVFAAILFGGFILAILGSLGFSDLDYDNSSVLLYSVGLSLVIWSATCLITLKYEFSHQEVLSGIEKKLDTLLKSQEPKSVQPTPPFQERGEPVNPLSEGVDLLQRPIVREEPKEPAVKG